MLNSGERRPRIFINASLSSLAEQRLNAEIASMIESLNAETYLPQRELPIDMLASAEEILIANMRAVQEADLIVSVLDKPGLGVAFELGFAAAIGKRCVLF